jgi:hypothetical protein
MDEPLLKGIILREPLFIGFYNFLSSFFLSFKPNTDMDSLQSNSNRS